MVGRGFRRTAVNDVALSQSDDFTANSIQDEVEAHPGMDGRKIHTVAIGMYLGVMTDGGYLKSWNEEGEKSKTYRVNGHWICVRARARAPFTSENSENQPTGA